MQKPITHIGIVESIDDLWSLLDWHAPIQPHVHVSAVTMQHVIFFSRKFTLNIPNSQQKYCNKAAVFHKSNNFIK